MIELNETQTLALIARYYPPGTAINQALINVFCNNYTMYRAEQKADLDKNSLPKKVKRIKKEITFIESLFN